MFSSFIDICLCYCCFVMLCVLFSFFIFLFFVLFFFFFFFFQAEDGIRDGHVTGVQTCALPILSLLALSIRALDFVVRALGPRRSHSTSRRTVLARDSWWRDCVSRNSSRFRRNSL